MIFVMEKRYGER